MSLNLHNEKYAFIPVAISARNEINNVEREKKLLLHKKRDEIFLLFLVGRKNWDFMQAFFILKK